MGAISREASKQDFVRQNGAEEQLHAHRICTSLQQFWARRRMHASGLTLTHTPDPTYLVPSYIIYLDEMW